MQEKCPEILDQVIFAPQMGTSDFAKLKPAENSNEKIKESTRKILSNIYEKPGNCFGVYLGTDGQFLQGILAGRAKKEQAEFLGYRARKKIKAQKIIALKQEILQMEANLSDLKILIQEMEQSMQILYKEYTDSHNFEKLNRALENEKNCALT